MSQWRHFCVFVDEMAWKLKRHNDVKLGFYDYFWTQRPKISPYAKFQLNISTNGWFFTFLLSQILWGTFCNFVAMATASNLTNWLDLQNVS